MHCLLTTRGVTKALSLEVICLEAVNCAAKAAAKESVIVSAAHHPADNGSEAIAAMETTADSFMFKILEGTPEMTHTLQLYVALVLLTETFLQLSVGG